MFDKSDLLKKLEFYSELKQINKKFKMHLHFSGYPLAKSILGLECDELEIKYLFKKSSFNNFVEKLSGIADLVIKKPFCEITLLSQIKIKFVPFYRFRYIKDSPVKIINNSKNISTTLLVDSNHRGITINSMFYDIETDRLKDFNNGLDDLNKELIVNWSPRKRLLEDPSRFIKTFAYAAELNKNVGRRYFNAMKKYSYIFNTKKFNIRKWLNKIVMSDLPSKYINGLQKTGTLKYILPFLSECYGIQQNEYHKHDVYTHCLLTCDNAPKDLALRLAALLHDIGKLETRKIINGKVTFHSHEVIGAFMAKDMLANLGYGSIAEEVTTLIREHMYNYTNKWSDRTLLKLMNKLNITSVESIDKVKLFKLRAADRLGKGLTEPVTQKQKDLEARIIELLERRR